MLVHILSLKTIFRNYYNRFIYKEVEPMPYTYPLEFKIKAIRRYEKG